MANPFLKVQEFVVEVWAELNKSSWPTRKDLINSTVLVIVTMLVLGAFVAIADLVFINFVKMLTKST